MFGTRPRACTAFAVLPDANSLRHTLIGQNWDWRTSDSAILLRIQRKNKPNILTFTEEGLIAKLGFNYAGIGLTANLLVSDYDKMVVRAPLQLILEKYLTQIQLEKR